MKDTTVKKSKTWKVDVMNLYKMSLLLNCTRISSSIDLFGHLMAMVMVMMMVMVMVVTVMVMVTVMMMSKCLDRRLERTYFLAVPCLSDLLLCCSCYSYSNTS